MVFMIPGEGERYDTCADVIGWYKCPSCGFSNSMVSNCSRVVCPECFTHWVSTAASRVSKRLHGFAVSLASYRGPVIPFNPKDPVYFDEAMLGKASKRCMHVILSPPTDEDLIRDDMDLAKVYDLAAKQLQKFFPGVVGAEIFFHPYRLRDDVKIELKSYIINRKKGVDMGFSYSNGGYWQLARADVLGLGSLDHYRVFSPHFHIISYGYLPPSADYNIESGGWIYKNKLRKNEDGSFRGLDLDITSNPDGTHHDEVKDVVSYILTHCGIVYNEISGKTTKTHRTYALMTPRFFRKSAGESFTLMTFLICPACLAKGEEVPLEMELIDSGIVYETYFDDTHMVNVTTNDAKRIWVITKIPNYVLHVPDARIVKPKVSSSFLMSDDRGVKL